MLNNEDSSESWLALKSTFDRMKASSRKNAPTSLAERTQRLTSVAALLSQNRDAIAAAITKDFGVRSKVETELTEIIPALDSIRYIKKNLSKWMKPEKRDLDPITFPLATAVVIPQPLGLVGVIVPWNFPINLSFIPIAYALASGNRVLVKMSENSNQLAKLLSELIAKYEQSDWIQFVADPNGDLGQHFSRLAFDHLLFTGSTETGRKVMASAAGNLCPVTLELGGKSPAVIAPDFPIKDAVARILFAKLLNAGQICTSVDYAFIPRGSAEEFIACAKSLTSSRYSSLEDESYTSIINQISFDRLVRALAEVEKLGCRVEPLLSGPKSNVQSRKIAPHIILNPPLDSQVMSREIFGPLLPVVEYDSIDQVIEELNSKERPLALYPFSYNKRIQSDLIDRVLSGGVTLNDTLLHVAAHDLPFGGVGASGMGHYHGREGFLMFSKLRPVLKQGPLSMTQMISPPYGRFIERFLKFAKMRES